MTRLARCYLTGLLLLGAAGGCRGTLSPLSNRIEVGKEPYVVFVADGEEGVGDLFAGGTAGGVAYQITFTRVDERAPALSPDGITLAFLRTRAPGDTTDVGLVFFNLLNGAERRVPIPAAVAEPGSVTPALVAWSRTGDTVYVRGATGVFQTAAPPASPALRPSANPAAADSAFLVQLGDPPAGVVIGCPEGPGLCVWLENRVVPLAQGGSAPLRWAGDSVAYVEAGELVIRPLGGGRSRLVRFTGSFANPRGWTMFGGGARPAPGATP